MAEPKVRQAQPDDERTPEQWAQFRQAEAKNQEDMTRRLGTQGQPPKHVTLEVQNVVHKNKSTVKEGPQNG